MVLAAISALAYFGVLSPQKLLPERTIFPAPIPNVDTAVIDRTNNTIEIAFRNNKGVAITLTMTGTATGTSGTVCSNANITGTYNNAAITNATSISNGAAFLLKWDCADISPIPNVGDKFTADFSFDYKNTETGQQMTQTGTVQGKYDK